MHTKNITRWERQRQNLSAAQIQQEITLMRLAYERREARHHSLNNLRRGFLPRIHPLLFLAVYGTCGLAAFALIAFFYTTTH